MDETIKNDIVKTVLGHYPSVQGIYLFGTHGTEYERPGSDVDIALILPPEQARKEGDLVLSQCRMDLESVLHKDVDLLNARQVSTVLQKEIISTGTILYCADRYALDEFEMLVMSFYQKLNEERAGVLAEGLASGRFYEV
jgi:predicted nucleotidyltransferase